MAITRIITPSITVDAVDNTKLDLTSNYAFTRTLSGDSVVNLVKIKSITISDDSSVEFVNGSNGVVLDSTYKVYKVIGTGIVVADQDSVDLRFNASTDTGSNYNVSKRNQGVKNNRGPTGDNNYSNTDYASTSATGGSPFMLNLDGNEALNQANFEMTLFDLGSSVTHKMMRVQGSFRRTGSYAEYSDVMMMMMTTSAIDAIKFELSASNMDSGTITLYGVQT